MVHKLGTCHETTVGCQVPITGGHGQYWITKPGMFATFPSDSINHGRALKIKCYVRIVRI